MTGVRVLRWPPANKDSSMHLRVHLSDWYSITSCHQFNSVKSKNKDKHLRSHVHSALPDLRLSTQTNIVARGRALTAHAYCRRQSHAQRCDSPSGRHGAHLPGPPLTGIAEEPGLDGAGGACPPMRPGAGGERHEPIG